MSDLYNIHHNFPCFTLGDQYVFSGYYISSSKLVCTADFLSTDGSPDSYGDIICLRSWTKHPLK